MILPSILNDMMTRTTPLWRGVLSTARGRIQATASKANAFPYLEAAVTLLLALGATGVSTWVMSHAVRNAAREEVVSETESLRDTIVDVVKTYEQVLRAGAGLVNAGGPPSRQQWRTFVNSLHLDKTFPGIQGLGYATVVSRAPPRKAEGAGEVDMTTSIQYLEPEDWRNRRAIGFDMYSEPVRRRAMQAARDAAEPRMSNVVVLMQEADGEVQPGALFYFPFFEGGEIPATVAERRRKLAGYIYGAFRLRDFIGKILSRHISGAPRGRVEVSTTGEDGRQRTIFDSGSVDATGGAGAGTYVSALDVPVAGQNWVVKLSSRADLIQGVDWSKPWIVAVSGTAISLLIAAISASLAMTRERSLASERRLAREVVERRAAEERAQLANGELIHRVKNTLAIVSAIASQTARHSTGLPDFVASFRDRLAALGTVQDLLRPEPSYTPDLDAFLHDILKPYSEAKSSRLSIEGPPVQIARNEAVLFCLFVNELATNATKYGAWSSDAGHVRITWSIEAAGEGATDRVFWVWKEKGGPVVVAPTRNGFGTHVMKSIERGMRAQMAQAFEADGIRYELIFPIAEGDTADAPTRRPASQEKA